MPYRIQLEIPYRFASNPGSLYIMLVIAFAFALAFLRRFIEDQWDSLDWHGGLKDFVMVVLSLPPFCAARAHGIVEWFRSAFWFQTTSATCATPVLEPFRGSTMTVPDLPLDLYECQLQMWMGVLCSLNCDSPTMAGKEINA
ncbi:hypothetical protein BC832DRAFT_546306 [Gaertneriomyces semiglobifer]|nr:hypothetical protein BC832DRAFT_546306 [Gaertneriomyces semiglobifer]